MKTHIRRKVAPFVVTGRLCLASALVLVGVLTGQALAQPVPASSATSSAKPVARPGAPAAQGPAGSVAGMGDVNLYPKRVVIDQKQRVATIGLFNRAVAQGDYEVALIDMMMTPEGRLVELGTVTDQAALNRVKTASRLLRWSPHRVTLGSHDSQTVRVMARVSPDLPAGEYRSHFQVTALPPVGNDGLSIEQAVGAPTATNTIGVTIVPRFGISIPVIVRVGETTLTTALRGLSVVALPGGDRALSLTITRDGTRSAFGDIYVTVAGTKTKVADIRGIGVYTEIDQRTLQIPLDPATDPRYLARGAKLTVTYTDDDFAPGKVLAKQDFTLP